MWYENPQEVFASTPSSSLGRNRKNILKADDEDEIEVLHDNTGLSTSTRTEISSEIPIMKMRLDVGSINSEKASCITYVCILVCICC